MTIYFTLDEVAAIVADHLKANGHAVATSAAVRVIHADDGKEVRILDLGKDVQFVVTADAKPQGVTEG